MVDVSTPISRWNNTVELKAASAVINAYRTGTDPLTLQKLAKRPAKQLAKMKRYVHREKPSFHTERVREENKHNKRLRDIETLRKEVELRRRCDMAEQCREQRRVDVNKQRFERAYDRLEKQTSVSMKLYEWDEKQKVTKKNSQKIKSSLPEMGDCPSRSQLKELNDQQSSIKTSIRRNSDIPITTDEIHRMLQKSTTGNSNSLLHQAINNQVTKSQMFTNNQGRRYSIATEMPSGLEQSASGLLADGEDQLKRGLPTETQSLMNPVTRRSSLMPGTMHLPPRSMSLDLSLASEEMKSCDRQLLAQKLYWENRRTSEGSNTLRMKPVRRNTLPNLISLKDYLDFEACVRRDQALYGNTDFGPEEAWQNLQTRYLRLSGQNVRSLESMCSSAGIDVSSHSHVNLGRSRKKGGSL